MKKGTGSVALLGGGEWTEPCRGLDSHLLHLAQSDDVLIVPTAAAFEHPDRVVERAVEWFKGLGANATGLPVLGSLGGLVAAHSLVVIPWVVKLVTASLAGFDRTIEEAAQNLGAGPWTTFRRVTLPSIRPGLVAGSLFGFVTSFGNLEMSLFLVGPGRTTLPIAILQYLEWKIDPTVAAASVIQIVLIGAAMIITDRYVKLSRVV